MGESGQRSQQLKGDGMKVLKTVGVATWQLQAFHSRDAAID